MLIGKPVVGLLGDGEIAEPEYPLATLQNAALIPRSTPNRFGNEQDAAIFHALASRILELKADEAAWQRMVECGLALDNGALLTRYLWTAHLLSVPEDDRRVMGRTTARIASCERAGE